MRPKNTTRQRFAPQRARRLEQAARRHATATDAELFGRMTDADPSTREAEDLRQRAQITPVGGEQADLFVDFGPVAMAAARIVVEEERKAIDRARAREDLCTF